MTELQNLIEEFLLDRRESDGGYAPVSKRDLALLWRIIEKLRTAKWGRDPDGALPIEYHIINRTEYRGSHYFPVPYLHFGDLGDAEKVRRHERALLANLDMAVAEFALYRRCVTEGANDDNT